MTRALALLLAALLPAGAAGAAERVDATVYVNPLRLQLELSTSRAATGERVRALATAANLGPAPLGEVTLTLRLDPLGLTMTGASTRTLAGLEPLESDSVSWRLCGPAPGAFLLLVRGTFVAPTGGAVTSESRALLIEVVGAPSARCPGRDAP